MRGLLHTTDTRLPEHDMRELADELAIYLTDCLHERVFVLSRAEIGELLESLIADLTQSDQMTVVWLVWDLFREAELMIFQAHT